MTADVQTGISPRQAVAARHLALTGDPVSAATAARVSPRTLRRWQATAAFQQVVRGEARSLSADAASTLLAVMGEAVEALRVGLRTGTPAGRIRAARTILELGLRINEADVDHRLSALEEKVGASWDHETTR